MTYTIQDLVEKTFNCPRTCTVDNIRNYSLVLATEQEYLDKIILSNKTVYTLVEEGKVLLPESYDITHRINPIECENASELFVLYHNYIYEKTYAPKVRRPAVGDIHITAVIGADGMRWIRSNGILVKMKHMGTVVIHERVDIGANTVIHRGTIDNTTIGEDCKIGSNCSIGHNCIIGKNTMITSGVSMAGSVSIGEGCWIGVGSSIRDNISICDGVRIGHGSVVTKSINISGTYFGNPARRHGGYDGRL